MTESREWHVELEQRLREAVRRVVDKAREYEEARIAAGYATRIVQEELARELGELLNGRAASMPQATYEQKKALANWVNNELRPLGLAVRCPATGRPAVLQASVGNDRAVGAFRFDTLAADGGREQRSWATRLPRLELVVDTSARVPRRIGPGR